MCSPSLTQKRSRTLTHTRAVRSRRLRSGLLALSVTVAIPAAITPVALVVATARRSYHCRANAQNARRRGLGRRADARFLHWRRCIVLVHLVLAVTVGRPRDTRAATGRGETTCGAHNLWARRGRDWVRGGRGAAAWRGAKPGRAAVAATASGPSSSIASTRQDAGRRDPYDDLITRQSGSPPSS